MNERRTFNINNVMAVFKTADLSILIFVSPAANCCGRKMPQISAPFGQLRLIAQRSGAVRVLYGLVLYSGVTPVNPRVNPHGL